MDWQEKEMNPPLSTWQYLLCTLVVLFLIAGLVSWCVGAPDEPGTSSSPTNSVSFLISSQKSGEQTSLALPLDFHPWGAFEPGAWTVSRTIVESRRLGRISSKTFLESSTVLREKQNNIFSTVTESCVLLAGKNIQKEPQTKQTDFLGLPPDETRQITELPRETLMIAGIPIECRVLKIVAKTTHYRRETRVWLNETTVPYIFRKERSVYRLPSNACCEHKVQNVTSTDLQLSLMGQVFSCYRYTLVSSYPTYISRSEVVASMAVPGRTVTQITRETDLRGRPLQVISTEILDFGSTDSEHQNRVFRSSNRQISSNATLEKPEDPTSEKSNDSQVQEESVDLISELELNTGMNSVSEEETTLVMERGNLRRGRKDSRFPRFFPNGKRLMSVEFSLEDDSTVSPQEAETQPEPLNSASKPQEEEDSSVNPEDFQTPFEQTGLRITQEKQEKSEFFTLMGPAQRESGFFPLFQLRWQMGKDLLLPEKWQEFTRLFPHLPGERWREFIRERNGVNSQAPKSRSPLYDENLRSQDPTEIKEEDTDFVFPEDSPSQTDTEDAQPRTELPQPGTLRRGFQALFSR